MKNILILFLMLGSTAVLANGNATSAYSVGLHYNLIKPEYDTQNTKQVVVYEFFGYKCPHCASFQPYMKSLHAQLPSYAKIIRVPLGFNPSWKVLAQGYYAAQSLGVLEKSHLAMFDALHKQRKQFRSIEDIADWYVSGFGVEKKEFLSAANSFAVDGMINKGNNMAIKMKIPNTPKLVINGKFMPMVKKLGSNEAVVDVTLELIKQEAKLMGLIK